MKGNGNQAPEHVALRGGGLSSISPRAISKGKQTSNKFCFFAYGTPTGLAKSVMKGQARPGPELRSQAR